MGFIFRPAGDKPRAHLVYDFKGKSLLVLACKQRVLLEGMIIMMVLDCDDEWKEGKWGKNMIKIGR